MDHKEKEINQSRIEDDYVFLNITGNKYWILQTGNTMKSHEQIIDHLKKQIPSLQVATEQECTFILVFCPIVSRAGTDIEAGLKKLNEISETKPAVFVVLHHTFNPDQTVPDSSRAVNRENTITLDCLFYEDRGLLRCHSNEKSLEKIINYLELQEKEQSWFEYAADTVSQLPSKAVSYVLSIPSFFGGRGRAIEEKKTEPVTANQLTGEEGMKKEEMEEILGKIFRMNTMILFTVTDELERKNTEGFEEFINSKSQEVQRLVKKCGGRYHLININEIGNDSQDSELKKLKDLVENNLKEQEELKNQIMKLFREKDRKLKETIRELQTLQK